MIGVRQSACEMHGCCFSPILSSLMKLLVLACTTKEKECYQQPTTDYPEWFSLPFGTCSRDCHDANANFDKDDADAEVYPTRYRENVCMSTNGSVASDILCGESLQFRNMQYARVLHRNRMRNEWLRMVAMSAYIHKLIRVAFNEECVCDIGWSGVLIAM